MAAFRPEVLTPEKAWARRLAARHLRRGEEGRTAALGALIDAGYSATEAAQIIRTMIAVMTP